jgi:TorA maturation chaperone TorD
MTLSDEDATRANFYGLLAHLFYASPDRALLEALADDGLLDTDGSALADAWQALVEAAAVTDCDTERAAYDKAFVDTDRARVTLYTRAYLPRYANEALLGALRADLAALGLSRREASREPEDHIAALCEAMRHLIATQNLGLAQQMRFFNRWIDPVAEPLCDAILRPRCSVFYEHVGRFAKAFFELERSAFEMFDAGTQQVKPASNAPPKSTVRSLTND